MKSLLVVCPTRNRPKRCREMLESFEDCTSTGTKIAMYVAEDDPQLGKYRELSDDFCRVAQWDFGPRLPVPEVYNHYYRTTDFDYYSVANDDFIYHTGNWDGLLVGELERHGGLGMAYGRTPLLPDSAVFSARSLRALGWWMPPNFTHQFVDQVQMDLFSALGQAYLVPEVWTEHKHPTYGTADWDDGYKEIYWGGDADDAAYRYWYWREYQKAIDLENLRKAGELAAV